jgi:hypothetical protein
MFAATCLAGGAARAQSLIAAPGTSGDQLLFFYDATSGRTLFLVVANVSQSDLTLEIDWYSQDLTSRLATQTQALAAGANVVLDANQVPGVTGNAGLTVVTPVVSATDARPIVPSVFRDTLPSAPSGSLIGGFTLADLSSNSAFGQNPLARVAVDAAGNRAPAGAIVDGTTVRYQRIAPDALFIPFYFNPASGTLTNRAFVAAFEDRYAASGFSIGPVSLNLGAALIDATGDNFANGTLPVNGVAFTDLQTLAGGTPFTRSGKVLLGLSNPLPANANLLGLMSQSLGTFAVGQGMPGYFAGGRFVDNGDGTVTDHQTGLQWEKKTTAVGSGMNLADPHDVDNVYFWSSGGGGKTFPDGTMFTDFLAKLNGASSDGVTLTGCFAGHCDWRLPTIVELQTLLLAPFKCGTSPCIDPVFGPTIDFTYWSATTLAEEPAAAWFVSFADGFVFNDVKDNPSFVRAVRAGS